jgi:L-alanine-DL-glutamate epimerase-like enolase superfamily enzyme
MSRAKREAGLRGGVGRRGFMKGAAALGLGAAAATPAAALAPAGPMRLRYRPYTLELIHTFTLASVSRTTTAVMLVEVEADGIVGYGEASMPPYLGESHETATAFLAKVDLGRYQNAFRLERILADVDALAPGNPAAKAAVDIALHDWVGKKLGHPWHEIWGLDPASTPPTSFTIGIDTKEVVRKKVVEAEPYRVLKVKLGRDNDKEMIETIRDVTSKPIRTDVNQGWTNRDEALRMVEWLAGKNVELVEQPLPKDRPDDNAWLTERSPLPIVGDESVQRLSDVSKAKGVYHGINVKLMKCTGLREAMKMVTLARALEMKVMLGCMTETSCGISAAAQLAPLVDWADLDGALLIRNDPFVGAALVDGRVVASSGPGIGARRREA